MDVNHPNMSSNTWQPRRATSELDDKKNTNFTDHPRNRPRLTMKRGMEWKFNATVVLVSLGGKQV